MPEKVCHGEDDSERAGKQDCFHITGEDDACWHLSVDVRDEAHLVASHIKRLVKRGQELDTEDYVVFRVDSQYHCVICVRREESFKWNQIVGVVNLDFNWTKFFLVGLVAFKNVVITGSVALGSIRQLIADHIVNRDPVFIGHQD